MNTIETKLKELEALVQPGVFYSSKCDDLVYEVTACRQFPNLIAALREAVARIEFYAAAWGKEHGYSEPTNEAIQRVLNEKRVTAVAGLKCIENILNGDQK